MQAGDYTDTGPIREPLTRRVLINDREFPLLDSKFDAEISSDLPEQVSGVTGFKARQGTVTVARPGYVVSDQLPTPVHRSNGWPPKAGDQLIIEDQIPGVVRWRQCTAVVDQVDGDLGDPTVIVSWTDDIDTSLAKPVTLPPVAEAMPGTEVERSGELRRYAQRTAIEPWRIIVEALEDAGYQLMPSVPDVDFYVLFQGSIHPRIGRIDSTNQTGDLLTWDAESGFQYLSVWSYFTPGYEGRGTGEDDYFTVYLRKTRGGPTAQTRWTMADGAEIRVTLVNNSAAVSRNGVVLVQMGFESGSPLPWVGASIGGRTAKLWTDSGTRTGSYAEMNLPGSAITWERVRVHGAAALAVSYVTRAGWPGFNWPSLRYRGGGAKGLVRAMTGSRTIENELASSVLEGVAKATLTGIWMDEYGTLNIIPSNVLESSPPVASIDTTWNVLKAAWTEARGSAASSVIVGYDDGVLTLASTVSVTVKQEQGGKTLTPGNTPEVTWVTPESEEEWIEPDMTPLSAGQNAVTSMRRGLFSMWGGSFVFDEGPGEDSTAYGWAMGPYQPDGLPEYLTMTIDQLSPRQWKMTHRLRSDSPEVQLVTLPNSSVLPVAWRGRGLPIWRARGRVLFTHTSVNRRKGGPSWAGAYEHDLAHWGTRADAIRLGDWLASKMSTSQFLLRGIEVTQDPRRQLGDVIDLHASETLRASFRCLVVGIHDKNQRQTVDLRIIRITAESNLTYEVIEALENYAEVESVPTYQQVENGEV